MSGNASEISHPLLFAYGLNFYYGTRQVLKDVTLRMDSPGVTAVLGPNGSGKSTFLKLLAGVLPWPSESVAAGIQVRGKDCVNMTQNQRARHFAYVSPELRAEFPLTALEVVRLGQICQPGAIGSRMSERLVAEAMELAQCSEFRDRDLHTLSGGEKQLVALARAIAQGSKILLLDEAFSRMDLHHQSRMRPVLQELVKRGHGVLVVSHDFNLASEWADRCLILQGGQVAVEGPTREVFTASRLAAIYPGASLTMGVNPSTGAPKVFPG